MKRNPEYQHSMSIKIDTRTLKAIETRAFDEDRAPSAVARRLIVDGLGLSKVKYPKPSEEKKKSVVKPIKSEFYERREKEASEAKVEKDKLKEKKIKEKEALKKKPLKVESKKALPKKMSKQMTID